MQKKDEELTPIQQSIGVADSSFNSTGKEVKYAIRNLAVNIFNGAKKKKKKTKFIKKKENLEHLESQETSVPLNLQIGKLTGSVIDTSQSLKNSQDTEL